MGIHMSVNMVTELSADDFAALADDYIANGPIDTGADATAEMVRCPVKIGTNAFCRHTVGGFIEPDGDDATQAIRLHIAARSARNDSQGKAHRRHWDNNL
jgi:hypothetical protein